MALSQEEQDKIEKLTDKYKRYVADMEIISTLKKYILEEVKGIICPHKIGDVVEINGFSWKGRKGKVLEVDAVWREYIWDKHKNKFIWQVRVIVLKKDGTESKNFTTFNEEGSQY